jgi:hypothetical protein
MKTKYTNLAILTFFFLIFGNIDPSKSHYLQFFDLKKMWKIFATKKGWLSFHHALGFSLPL